MKNYWKERAKKWKLCFLAPMDWYGDSAYRQTIKKVAPNIDAITEFYSADWLVHSKFLADAVLPHKDIEKPLVVQIFWKDPEMFVKAAKIIEKYDYVWIDINMGCPAKKVVRSGHWSSLMINTDTAFEIVEKLNKATSLPISVKTRIWYENSDDLIKFAKWLENAGCSLLTVHGRTTKQAYTWFANWDPIYELKRHINIPVIGNWDVKNFADGMDKVKNLDGFMIWRASFGNPWCFSSHPLTPSEPHPKPLLRGEGGNESNLLESGFVDGVYFPSLGEILDMMVFHASKLVETKGERTGSLEIRKHLVQYLKNFPWVKGYRKRLVTTESLENSLDVIWEIRSEFWVFLDKRPWLGEVE